MIIQCEQCGTKFKLDDAKVKDKGVKVRCAKCRYVFTVAKDQSQLEQQPDFAAMLEQSADLAHDKMSAVSFELEPEPAAAPPSDFEFDTSSLAPEEAAEKPLSMDTGAFELPKEDAAAPTVSQDDFDLSALSWNDELPHQPDEKAAGGEVDFSGMVGDDSGQEADKTVVSSSIFANIEDMTIVQSPVSLEKMDLDSFADSIKSQDDSDAVGTDDGKKGAEPFVISEIDFGDALAMDVDHPVNPETLESSHEMFFMPLDEDSEARPKTDGAFNIQNEAPAAPDSHEEMPPLSIASRRKQSPLVIALIVGAVLAVAAVVGYFGFNLFTEEEKAKEVGRISLRAVNASYVKSGTVGEMLVITGEAVNSYDVPRAAIQVKGVVYGENSQVLASKSAFAGNPISNEQLATMTLEKIEAAMANQFGDSLANMEVSPGKAIPFVVVITQLPPGAKDYGIELVGSTVSTGKK